MTVSIIIPTYNRPELLRRALASALRAAPQGGEIIVVNDGQIAMAREAVAHHKDSRLKLLDNRGVNGPAGARNFGIQSSSNDIVIFLDDDDEILPDYPAYVLEHHRISGCDYGFSSFIEVTDSEDVSIANNETLHRKPYPEGEVPPTKKFKDRVAGFGMGFWITRSAYHAVGEFDDRLRTSEDIDYQCRLINQGRRGWYGEAPGVVVHRHAALSVGDRSHQMERTGHQTQSDDFKLIIRKHLDLLRADSAVRRYLTQRYVKCAARAGGNIQAIKFLFETGLLLRTPLAIPYLVTQSILARR